MSIVNSQPIGAISLIGIEQLAEVCNQVAPNIDWNSDEFLNVVLSSPLKVDKFSVSTYYIRPILCDNFENKFQVMQISWCERT